MEKGEEVRQLNKRARPIVDALKEGDWYQALTLLVKLRGSREFVLYKNLWNAVHGQTVSYYSHANTLALEKPIPHFHVVRHHAMMAHWKALKDRGRLPRTIVHVDTHPDMNMAKDGSCHEIGAAVTCFLNLWRGEQVGATDLTVVWVIPAWIYDVLDEDMPVVLTKRGFHRRTARNEDRYMDFPLLKRELIETDVPFVFSKVRTGPQLDRALSRTGEPYILDVDLDYFACNGNPTKRKTYKRILGNDDVASHGRVLNYPGVRSPRHMGDDRFSRRVTRQLDQEAQLIRKRVKDFTRMIDTLPRPDVVNLSDSCHVDDSKGFDDPLDVIYTNAYTPTYFVPWIRAHLPKRYAGFELG